MKLSDILVYFAGIPFYTFMMLLLFCYVCYASLRALVTGREYW